MKFKFEESCLVTLTNLEFNFFIVLWSNFIDTIHYFIVSNTRIAFSVRTVLHFFLVLKNVFKKLNRKSSDLATLLNKW